MNLAYLKTDSPWHAVFPDGVPIINILVPNTGVMEGDRGNAPQEYYKVDVAKLPPAKLEEVCERVARQCGGSRFEVCAAIERDGFIPLRAIHVSSVVTDSRAFL